MDEKVTEIVKIDSLEHTHSKKHDLTTSPWKVFSKRILIRIRKAGYLLRASYLS